MDSKINGIMKVTILSLDNWGFNKYISNELIRRGVKVVNINFHESVYKYPTLFHQMFNFFSKNFFNYNLKRKHLEKVISERVKSLPYQDKILVIKSDTLNGETVKNIKQNSKETITFLNDSIGRCPKLKNNIHLFDKRYSFESNDVTKYNLLKINNYIYTDLLDVDITNKQEFEYDIFNVGSLNKRIKSLPKFASYFRSKNITYKLIAHSKSKEEALVKLGIEVINYKYSISEMLEMLVKSKALLDIQRPKQEGLSFRVLESLAFNKKLITTNKSIAMYDFYDSNNIHIINDVSNIDIPMHFFKTDYNKVNDLIVKKYHISSWVEEVFDLQ